MKGNKKQLTDKEIEEIIEKKYSKKLPHTKDYIREQLKKDPNYKCKFSMVKQDFIDEYYRSREGKLCPSFDFTDKKISVLLFNILIENKDPEDIINIPKIKYRKED